jgi:glutaredoxin
MAKDYFTANNVPFEEYNVGTDIEKRKEMLELTGQMGVPVITVEGETEPVIGFDKPHLTKVLGL